MIYDLNLEDKPYNDNQVVKKMTAFAKPNQIVIGQLAYDVLDYTQRSTFKVLPVSSDVWSYASDKTGDIYSLYASSIKE